MPKVKRSPSLGVCLLSPHPGLLAELQRLFSGPRFKVTPVRLNYGPVLDPTDLRLPQAAVFLIDASPARAAAKSLLESVRDRFPQSQVIILKETLKDEMVFPYLRLGAKGVLRYEDTRRDLVRAVKVVVSGGVWIARSQLARYMDAAPLSSRKGVAIRDPGNLSRREREVLLSLLQGLSNKEIAAKLNISERTVKFHVSHLLQKFGAQRRADLILKYFHAWPTAS